MLEYHTEKFYHKYLMDDFYVVAEKNLQSGSVSSQGDVADTLVMGKDGASSFASLITFNTSSMLDTTLAKASVFLRRKGLSGTNPISGSLQLKIKSGQIGATINVEATDYAAQTDDVSTPCLFGSNNGNDHWIRLDLPPSALAHIKQNAVTQIIIEAPTAANGLVVFYDGTNPAYAPVLNLKYGQTPTSINKIENNNYEVTLNCDIIPIDNGYYKIYVYNNNVYVDIIYNKIGSEVSINLSFINQNIKLDKPSYEHLNKPYLTINNQGIDNSNIIFRFVKES